MLENEVSLITGCIIRRKNLYVIIEFLFNFHFQIREILISFWKLHDNSSYRLHLYYPSPDRFYLFPPSSFSSTTKKKISATELNKLFNEEGKRNIEASRNYWTRYLLLVDRNFGWTTKRRVSVCLSGMIGAKSGVHLSLLSLMEELALPPGHSLSCSCPYTRGRRKTKREGRKEGKEGGRKKRGAASAEKKKKGSMHPVCDTRLSGEFELKKDVEPGGDSYLAHILKLETFTNRRPSRVGNGGV